MNDGERIQLDVLRGVLDDLAKGYYDSHLFMIETAVIDRKEKRRQEVQDLVQEVYGPNATISIPRK